MHLCSPICQAFICILLPARSPLLFALVTRSIVLWKEGRRLRKKECLVGLQMKTTIHQCLRNKILQVFEAQDNLI